jgi:hypothetical protein
MPIQIGNGQAIFEIWLWHFRSVKSANFYQETSGFGGLANLDFIAELFDAAPGAARFAPRRRG